jgi:hypothetical protein
MKAKTFYSLAIAATIAALGPNVHAEVSRQTLDAISAPDKVETRLGTLEYKDGVPTPATVQNAYDNLDFMHAVDVYLNAFQGVSTYAALEGFRSIGVEDNQIVIFPRLMDSKSLFLTANADTVYFLGFLDLGKGPIVLETPPDSLGTLDDMWFNWVVDFGLPGPDRGMGGKYLILPPGYPPIHNAFSQDEPGYTAKPSDSSGRNESMREVAWPTAAASERIFRIRASGWNGLPLTMPIDANCPIRSGSPSASAGSSCTNLFSIS